MGNKRSGFTLVELIVVISILGILAAFVIPRFFDVQGKARAAVMDSVGGAIKSASAVVHSAAVVSGSTSNVALDGGVNVSLAYGYATAANNGIVAALSDHSGVDVSIAGDVANFYLSSGGANCYVTYTAATDASTPPVISVSNNCT